MKKLMLICLAFTLVLGSCTKKPEDIFEEEKSGVVMVMNKYYYKMQIPNGEYVYFTGITEDGELEGFTGDENEVKQNPAYCTGTAFFISKDGELLTNRHVASPPINKDEVKKCFSNLIKSLQELCYAYMEQCRQEYQAAEEEASTILEYDEYGNLVTTDSERLQELADAAQELEQKYNEAQEKAQSLEQLNDPSQITIEPVCQLGITLDGANPDNVNDFLTKHPCKVVRVSGNEEVDLALLKLTGSVPSDIYVFDASECKDDVSISDDVFMIGYNAGPEIATTKKGIKSQFTQGKVTQQPDGERVLYSIPTIAGSSGSPIINAKGQLVAVNYAKHKDSDNFNLGVPLKAIRHFLD